MLRKPTSLPEVVTKAYASLTWNTSDHVLNFPSFHLKLLYSRDSPQMAVFSCPRKFQLQQIG